MEGRRLLDVGSQFTWVVRYEGIAWALRQDGQPPGGDKMN